MFKAKFSEENTLKFGGGKNQIGQKHGVISNNFFFTGTKKLMYFLIKNGIYCSQGFQNVQKLKSLGKVQGHSLLCSTRQILKSFYSNIMHHFI